MTVPRFEIVRSSAGFHARFRSSNGNIIMSSEVYARRRGALRAAELIAGADVYYSPFQDWPEILHGRRGRDRMVEVRDVDERQDGAS
jgi:uncharacterized protein YegP (UPF0339 family)